MTIDSTIKRGNNEEDIIGENLVNISIHDKRVKEETIQVGDKPKRTYTKKIKTYEDGDETIQGVDKPKRTYTKKIKTDEDNIRYLHF